MGRIKKIVLFLIITMILFSCKEKKSLSSIKSKDITDFVEIALVDNKNLLGVSVDLVDFINKKSGIKAVVEGSLVYSLSVPKRNVQEAISLIKQRVKDKHYTGVTILIKSNEWQKL